MRGGAFFNGKEGRDDFRTPFLNGKEGRDDIRGHQLLSNVNHRQNVTTDFQQLAHSTFFKKSILLIGIAKATYQAALTFTFLFEL